MVSVAGWADTEMQLLLTFSSPTIFPMAFHDLNTTPVTYCSSLTDIDTYK